MTKPKSTRVTNVQVPGASAPADTAQPPASSEGAKPEVTVTMADEAKLDGIVNLTKSASSAPRNYRAMHAADIDPSTLTAPVMTLDGYLCPITPEKK